MINIMFSKRLINCSKFLNLLRRKSTTTTLSPDELVRFDRISKEWWDLNGPFKCLHSMNELRVPLIRDGLTKLPNVPTHKPLKGLKILDVGCGGGILSEPHSRLGAQVTGIDASDENIKTAKYHANLDDRLAPNLTYRSCLVEELVETEREKYDGVVLSEIVEHVSNVELFVRSSCSLIKPGGSVFITTMNKTTISYLLSIVAAEKIFNLAPDGIHDWNKFVPPEQLTDVLTKNNFHIHLIHGMFLNPLNLRWCWCRDQSNNYAMHAVKCTRGDDTRGDERVAGVGDTGAAERVAGDGGTGGRKTVGRAVGDESKEG